LQTAKKKAKTLPQGFEKIISSGTGFDWYEIGYKYYTGDEPSGITQDKEKAFFWFDQTSQWFMEEYEKGVQYRIKEKGVSGTGLIWYDIGLKYTEGDDSLGISEDEAIAFFWFDQASDWFMDPKNQGIPEVQHKIGVMYQKGRVFKMNPRLAVEWFQKAAENGHFKAQSNLAYMYEAGSGVTRDRKMAFTWYLKAAIQGYDYAQVCIGAMYEEGLAVERNTDEAKKWYTEAANQGNEEAAEALDKLEN